MTWQIKKGIGKIMNKTIKNHTISIIFDKHNPYAANSPFKKKQSQRF